MNSISPVDMAKLARAFFDNLQRDSCEYGGIGLDSKRPFGNSDVDADILEILELKPGGEDEGPCWTSEQRQYAASCYENLIPYLQEKYGAK